jgi:hypothetical protein
MCRLGPIVVVAALMAGPTFAQSIETETQTAYTYGSGDFGKTVLRSSSTAGGMAMTDTLPAGTANGSQLSITNVDLSGLDTVTASPSGTVTIAGAATLVIPPGRAVALTYDGTSNWVVQNNTASALIGPPTFQPYPYVPLPALNLPIQFGQSYGPTNIQDMFAASGNVTFFWYPYYPVPGVWSGLDVPAYRLSADTPVPSAGCGPAACSTWIDWLYYNHPDWIMYLDDRATIGYAFAGATVTGATPPPLTHQTGLHR